MTTTDSGWTVDTLHEHYRVLRDTDLAHAAALRANDEAHRIELQRLSEEKVDLQAKEYERRLEDLNGEAGTIKGILAQSVTAEKFDDYQQSEEARRITREESVDSKVDDVHGMLVVLTGEVREDRVRDAARRRQNSVLIAGIASVLTLIIAGAGLAVALL